MKPLVRLCFVALCITVLGTACRQYLPTNRYLQLRAKPMTSTADARGKFDHARHAPVLAEQRVTCLGCHRFDTLIDASSEPLARELSLRSQHPGSEVCHYCHGSSETHAPGAPEACTTCHEHLAALRPANHELSWLKVHASAVRTDPTSCANCHAQAFCIDCHERRDTIQTRVHERNFRFFHSVEARANPMQCGRCHRQDFCIACHQQGRVD